MTTTQLARVARSVDSFHRNLVKPRWTINTSYTMDVEYIRGEGGDGDERSDDDDDDVIRLIELNSFGAEMAAASGLFHWERDEHILYGSSLTSEEKRTICIRVRE